MKYILLVGLILTSCYRYSIGVNTEPLVNTSQVMTVCNSYGLNIRACPSTECKIVGWLQDGDIVTVRSESIRWTKIDGGWVRNRYLCNSTRVLLQ